MEIVAKRLKELRLEAGLTQQQAAEKLHVSRVVFNRYENNQREIPLELLCEIANLFDVSIDYLVGRVDF